MRRVSHAVTIRAPVEAVFAYLDDTRAIGKHMMSRSMPMMGGRMDYDFITPNPTGVGATYRGGGSVLGMRMEFTCEVSEWKKNERKVWRTVGTPRLLIIGPYEMGFTVADGTDATTVDVWISYELPRSIGGRVLGALLATSYARWCARSVAEGAKRELEARLDERSARSGVRA